MQADLSTPVDSEDNIGGPKQYKNMAACIHFLVTFLKKLHFYY